MYGFVFIRVYSWFTKFLLPCYDYALEKSEATSTLDAALFVMPDLTAYKKLLNLKILLPIQ